MKKTRLTLFSIVMATMVLFVGCKKEKAVLSPNTSNNRESSIQQTNTFIMQYALSLAKLLENEEVRQVIKEEAMKKTDGDYDILASTLHNKELCNGITIGEKISELLDNYKPDNITDYLNSIITAIPNLQVSVPVNCDNWDVDGFIPAVVPVSVNFDDKTNQSIVGYNKKEEPLSFSLKEDPNVPVVVVSVSERIDEKGNFRWEDIEPLLQVTNNDSLSIKNRDVPMFPTSLTLHHGAAHEIILEWPDVSGESGYKIYRKTGSGNFVQHAITTANNNGYVDQNLHYGTRYWYKVSSFNSDGESAFSPLSTTIASGRNDGDKLTLNRMMFNTSNDLNSVESWIRGVPELRFRLIKGVKNSSTAEYVYRSNIISPPSRSSIVGQWWTNLMDITHWYTDVCGTVFIMDWEEEDDLLLNSITLTGKYENKETGTFENGGTITFSTSDNGPIGFTPVYYWDNPYATNEYTINGFKWSFKSYIIPVKN